MTELGVSLPFDGIELHEHRDAIAKLAAAGYRGLWTGEVNGADGLTPLALFSAWQPEMTISCAVVSAYTRAPGLLAMSAAALGELAPGRARFGIGAGSDVIINQWNGIPFTTPYARVAETLRYVRSALAGDRPTAEGTFRSHGFRLSRIPTTPPKLVLAALGSRMQRLAAAEADGVVLNFLSADDIATVKDAAASVTREVDGPFEISARVFVVPGEGTATEAAARRHIAGYLTVPVYAEFQRWLGRASELEPMWRAWSDGDRQAATSAIPDAVVSDIVMTGSARSCAAGVRRYVEAGIDAVTIAVLAPLGGGVSPAEQVEFLCEMGRWL